MDSFRYETRSSGPLWPWELVDVLQRFKHPRHWNIGIESTRFGNQPRAAAGIDPCGTIWVSSPCVYYSTRSEQWLAEEWDRREFLFAVPKNQIPRLTLRTARFDEDRARWVDGELKRGWLSTLETLLKGGHVRACADISYLIGKDSRELCPPHFRI